MVTRKQWRVLYRALLEYQILASIRYQDSLASSADIQAFYRADLERANEALEMINQVQVDWSTPEEEAA